MEARKSSGITSDPGQRVSPIVTGQAKTSDFVVGRYDDFGRVKEAGQIVGGPNESARLKKLMLNSMQTRGGALMPGFVMSSIGPVKSSQIIVPEKSKGKRSKKKEVVVDNITEEYKEEVKVKATKFTVTFNIDTGKIKTKVDAILEDPTSIALIFEDEDSIGYLPEKGSKLNLILPDNREVNVLYLGIQLPWYLSNQQILVFMRVDIEE